MNIINQYQEALSTEKRLRGYLVQFDEAHDIVHAAEKVRDAGFRRWDVHTPFPVHGLDEAMGIRATILPWISFAGGLTGAVTALGMQWWMNAVNYPYLISGKPLFSLPANIPIIFEMTVLFGAIATVVGMFVLNDLPQYYHPVFSNRRFLQVTTDKFFIVIDAEDTKFDAEKTRAFLETLEGVAVEPIED
jgi:hypothetical protein